MAFLASAGFLAVQYGTASAITDPQFVTVGARIQSVASGGCLTPPAGNGASTTIEDCADQRWSITTDGRVMSGGKCLDSLSQGTANGTVVTVWSCSGGESQRFNLTPGGTITGVQSKRCLDVNGADVRLWDCSDTANQKWVLGGGTSPTTGPTTAPPTSRPTASPTPNPGPTGIQTTAAQTVGGGTLSSPAVGPGPTSAAFGTGFTLIKNWDFGSGGTIRGIADMSKEFVYHDQFNTIGNGSNYGAITLAPDAANAISGQPVENPNNPVRQFTAGSVKTTLVPLTGATTVSPTQHNVGNGSFMAKWGLPKGGSLLGHDILWETRVRYVTPRYFWFALWNSGNLWNHGAEFDLVESFGYDNGSNGTNFDGRFWHADPVGGTKTTDYTNWGSGMAAHGIRSYDPTQYHVWSLLYRANDSFSFFVDGIEAQSGTMNWTNGATAGGQPIDFRFLFDAGWGHTQVASVNHSMPASELAGKFYEFDYSRVYERR